MAKLHTAIVLVQDGSIVETTYTDKDSLATLRAAVSGPDQDGQGWIESVSYWVGMDAYANEEGLYTSGLTVNPFGVRVFGQSWMGNIVIPKITPNKRARLIKKGIPVNAE